MKITKTSRRGFTLVEIMIVVAIIGLLAAIGIPNYLHASRTSQTTACIDNLRKIDGAKAQWALELGKNLTDVPVSTDLEPYFGRGNTSSIGGIYCPLSGQGALNGYAVNAVGTAPQCNNYNPATHPGQLN
jgi:prepilin-type N-terminal cleavage/methylation domain-containing protein